MDPARFIVELFARSLTFSDPKDLGRKAEDLAVLYLRLKGYRILERNWRLRSGEIDLIAEKGDTLVFIEVKARRRRRYGLPEEAVTPFKQQKLLTLAQVYLSSYQGSAKRIRFDVVSVEAGKAGWRLQHLEGVIEDGRT